MRIHHLDRYLPGERNSTYGGNSGDKEGIVIDGKNWIVKYPKRGSQLKGVESLSYSQTPESEYIGSHIYEILGYSVHKTVLGIRNGHIVVACKDFCGDKDSLIEFRQLKNTYNKTLNEKLSTSMSSTGSDHFSLLDELMIHFQYNPALQGIEGLEERFWNCVIVDGLINNNDRNNGNWGILRGPNEDRLAPVYDNGASFSPNVPEQKIIRRLNDEDILQQSACSGITSYSLDGEGNALFRDIIALDISGLNKAIRKNVPLIRNKFSEICRLIDGIPETFEGFAVLSKERKTVYKKELAIRFEKILVPRYEQLAKEKLEHLVDLSGISRGTGGYGDWSD